jgi:hypothetical protein
MLFDSYIYMCVWISVIIQMFLKSQIFEYFEFFRIPKEPENGAQTCRRAVWSVPNTHWNT